MEQLEGSPNTEIQEIKAHLTEAECPQRERKDGITGVGERATSQSELLETDGLTEIELKAKIAGLESQLDARGDLLGERETEIAGLKMKLESQIESLKAYVEISESAGRTENELKAKIADLERQLEAQQGTLAARDMEVSEIKTKADPQIQFLKHQFHEREDEIRAKESALQQQEEQYQGEINELRSQLSQKESLLKKRDEAMSGVKNQTSSHVALLKVVNCTGEELKAIKSLILRRQWGPRLVY